MKLRLWVKLLIVIILGGAIYMGAKEFIFNKNEENVTEKNNEDNDNATLVFAKENGIYKEEYEKEYKDITLSDKDNFKEVLETFLPKGYKGKEINYIMNLSSKNIELLKNKDYVDISNYYEIKNFNVLNIDRYNEYAKNNNYELKDVVTYVNINLDLPVYTNTTEVKDGNDYLVLVNKYHSLPNNYKPSDLDYIDGQYGNKVPMRKVAKEALENLQKAVKEEIGITLNPTTAFRDQSFQKTLYDNYVKKDGVTAADTYSARPGYSEHQTGLAIDLKNPAIKTSTRLNPSDYEWLKNNAYRFGFIIRFPGDKEFITGYQEENWHIRYVGLDVAKTIYENNLTLEEYIDLYVTEY